MENPPLWVWAIVVGLIIAGKFAYRWRMTKQLAQETQREKIGSSKNKSKSKNNNNDTGCISNIRTTMSHKYSRHRYSPSFFRNYFEGKDKAP